MPKITYLDESPERPSAQKPSPQPARRMAGAGFVVLFLFLSLLMGLLGAVGGIMAVTDPTIAAKLGIDPAEGLDLGITKTEKLVLEESSAVVDAAARVSPAVVSISTSRNVLDFFGRTVEQRGGGTGFIITSDGLVVTNKHVVSDESATYTVFTSDGKDFAAEVLALDPLNDLAILKIAATGLPVVELGSATELRVGQHVIAIGNALGEFSNSVTLGVVSAIDRQITASGGGVAENLSGLIQTDAAINPGNSGGPLVNLKGQVVGINTAVAGGAENIGFAIPVDVARKAIDSVKRTGKIERPQIGIRYVPVTRELAQTNDLPVDHGVWVLSGTERGAVAVIPGSPADKAGIEENDIITEIDGKRIDEEHSLLSRLADYNPGDTVTLTVYHDGESTQVQLTLGVLD